MVKIPSFIEKSNCHGIRPVGIIDSNHISRPGMISKLLRERSIARYIVAPKGYGKSTLAYEYAHIVFSFEHVFWIRCTSPCFLRDLDAGDMYESICRSDPDVSLVVFDDVPILNESREELFNRIIESLLGDDCEVISICAPTADSFVRLQAERIVIAAKELILSDDELEYEVARGRLDEGREISLARSEKIPCLIWGREKEKDLLKGMVGDDLAIEYRLLIFVIMVFQKGSLVGLENYLSKEKCGFALDCLESQYPYLGIDFRTKTFNACSIDIDLLAEHFFPILSLLAEGSQLKHRDAFCITVVDSLISLHENERARKFFCNFATKECIGGWIERRGWEVLFDSNALLVSALCEHLSKGSGYKSPIVDAVYAWSLIILGDIQSALKAVGRIRRSDAPNKWDLLSSQILSILRFDNTQRYISQKEFEGIKQKIVNRPEEPFVDASSDTVHRINWDMVAAFVERFWMGAEPGTILETWLEWMDEAEDRRQIAALMLVAVWVIELVCITKKEKKLAANPISRVEWIDSDSKEAFVSLGFYDERLEMFLNKCMDVLSAQDEWGYAELFVASSIKNGSDLSIPYFESIANYEMEKRINGDLKELLRQKSLHRQQNDANLKRKIARAGENENFFRREDPEIKDKSISNVDIPTLYVSLFGGFEVKLDDQIVASKYLHRKKVRAILAILIIGRGREVSRENIAKTVWPDSGMDSYKNSFYSVWSQMRSALTINGKCPYLIRTQEGCKIDTRYVKSDLYEFDDLCRSLMFGADSVYSWEDLYSRVSDDFSDDFLPCEQNVPQINRLREKYRENLIDALISASERLNDMNESRGALWFAREAYRRNDKREDVYIALMEAQIASDQRTSALSTYFKCRKYLIEELGIDPSMRLIQLYRSIIESEEKI